MIDYVRVDSPIFGDDLGAYVQTHRGEFVTVRLDLPDDHPAMQDAIADGFSADQAEFIDLIHVSHVRTVDGLSYARTRVYMTHLARTREEDYKRRLARARARLGRPSLPELDIHLARHPWSP